VTQLSLTEIAPIITELARDAGPIALAYFRKISTEAVESKGHLDLVTQADKDVEAFLTARIRAVFPDDGVFGEEGAAHEGTSGRLWVIDPIDGTFNFVRGNDQWAISIGLHERGRPVFGVIYAPARDELFAGGEGIAATRNNVELPARSGMDRRKAACGVGFHPVIPVDERLKTLRFIMEDAGMTFRCCGSATMSLAEVARGEVDGYIGTGESSWDLMAALPILSQIGIRSTVDWGNIDLRDKLRFACGTPEFLDLVAPLVPFGTKLLLPQRAAE
jgi:myo-inositol-1(or 4)-monophosphatase